MLSIPKVNRALKSTQKTKWHQNCVHRLIIPKTVPFVEWFFGATFAKNPSFGMTMTKIVSCISAYLFLCVFMSVHGCGIGRVEWLRDGRLLRSIPNLMDYQNIKQLDAPADYKEVGSQKEIDNEVYIF